MMIRKKEILCWRCPHCFHFNYVDGPFDGTKTYTQCGGCDDVLTVFAVYSDVVISRTYKYFGSVHDTEIMCDNGQFIYCGSKEGMSKWFVNQIKKGRKVDEANK